MSTKEHLNDFLFRLYKAAGVPSEWIRKTPDLTPSARRSEGVRTTITMPPMQAADLQVQLSDATARLDAVRLELDAAHIAADRQKCDCNEKVESAQRERDHAQRACGLKDEFIANLAHELRNPINSILIWSQTLRRGRPNGEEIRDACDAINTSGDFAASLIANVMDMNRLISCKIRLDMRPVELLELVESVLKAVKPSADAKQVRIERMLYQRAASVVGDPLRLRQIIENLLSNAIKFTPAGGKVSVLLERVNCHIELSVKDDGRGIDPEYLPKVFDRMSQEDSSMRDRQAGLGLGLSLVKSLTEMHGGAVRAESAGKGQGSAFYVSLPLLTGAEHGFDDELSADDLIEGIVFILHVADDAGDSSYWVETLRGEEARRWYEIYRTCDWAALGLEAMNTFHRRVSQGEMESIRRARPRCVYIYAKSQKLSDGPGFTCDSIQPAAGV